MAPTLEAVVTNPLAPTKCQLREAACLPALDALCPQCQLIFLIPHRPRLKENTREHFRNWRSDQCGFARRLPVKSGFGKFSGVLDRIREKPDQASKSIGAPTGAGGRSSDA
jgi:hypothetical protein